MADFAQLLVELEDLQKAKAAPFGDKKDGDKKDAAADGNDAKKPMGTKDAGDDRRIEAAAKDGARESDKDDEEFGKAFRVRLEDGTEADAFDGTAMLKALHSENGEMREHIVDMQKAFEMAVDVIRTLRTEASERDTMIKAIGGRVDAMATAGTGRRTMLTVAEKMTPGTGAAAAAAGPAQPTANQVMMKAQFLARENKLDWGALPRIEAYQGRGQLAPADLLQRFPELLIPIA